MEKTKDRYRNANEISNERWLATQDPGRQTLTSSLAAGGQTSFGSGRVEGKGGGAQQEEDSFAIHLLGFSSTEDHELDALYQEGETHAATREAEGAARCHEVTP